MILSKAQIAQFQKVILNWWEKNKRDLPWRHTHDPYKILVSEVMLQQTQVSRVLTRYTEFIEAFPTVNVLASASPAQVLRLWKGMGYNRRALYLHQTAKNIVQKYNGSFPKDEEKLVKLPGLGKYTARAILVFAFKQNIAMVDTNIRQIITHFFFHDTPQPEKIIQEVADQLVPIGKSWEWHQAMMDFGAEKLIKLKVHKACLPARQVIKSKPFKETNRYFRGRTMDELREKSYKEKKLIKMLCSKYGKDEIFYINLLKGLEKDGLVVNKKAVWKLPG